MLELGEDSSSVYEELKKRNIWVRGGGDWDLPRHLRASFGLPEENRALVEALRQILS